MGEVAIRKTESFWDQVQKMEERIMHRAEDIFRGNGNIFGKDLDNWLAAERELVWKPAIELTDKKDHFELRVAVAGIDPKDLQVEVTSDALLVKGETQHEEKKEEEGKVYVREFESGALFRSIHFPKKVDPDKVKAEMKNGMLTVTAPIAETAPPAPKKVAVHAS